VQNAFLHQRRRERMRLENVTGYLPRICGACRRGVADLSRQSWPTPVVVRPIFGKRLPWEAHCPVRLEGHRRGWFTQAEAHNYTIQRSRGANVKDDVSGDPAAIHAVPTI
jgi:hypothetical protein